MWYFLCFLFISVLNLWSCLYYLLIVENKGLIVEGFWLKVESFEGENEIIFCILIMNRILYIILFGLSLVWFLLLVLIFVLIFFWCWGNLYICGNECGECNFFYYVNFL